LRPARRFPHNEAVIGTSADEHRPREASSPRAGEKSGSPTTLDFLLRLLRWRKWILINTAVVALVAVVVSLLLPNWYASHVSILPPEEDALDIRGISGNIARAAAALSGGGGLSFSGRMNLPMWAVPSDLLAGILRSRRLAERVVAEHDLITVYESDNLDRALETYWKRVRVRVGPEGIVRLRVLDKSPARAAGMAATAVRVLDEIQRETRHAGAGQVRAFVAARLAATAVDLGAAEESLRVFEERFGLLVPEEQARALVQAIADVEAERLAAEVEREALASQVGAEHPEIRRVEARLRSLEAARMTLEGRASGSGFQGAAQGPAAGGAGAGLPAGSGAAATEAVRAGLIDLGRLPDLSLQFLRRYRAVEVLEALHALLMEMHEQYRILEVRDTPTIQLLDAPAVPIEKDRPHRAVICILAVLLACGAGLGVAAALESLAVVAETDPARHARLTRLLRGVGLGFLARR